MKDVIVANYKYILSRLERGYKESINVLIDLITLENNSNLDDYCILVNQLENIDGSDDDYMYIY